MVKFIYIAGTSVLPPAVYKLIKGRLVHTYYHTAGLELVPL